MARQFLSSKTILSRLVAEGEHQQQDFKYKITDACKLSKSVSAFANTDGGRLLIGVRDDGHLSGVRSEEEMYMMPSAAKAGTERLTSITAARIIARYFFIILLRYQVSQL